MFGFHNGRRATWRPRRRYADTYLRMLIAEWNWHEGEKLATQEGESA